MIYTAVKRIIQDLLTLGKVFVKSGRPSGAPKAQSLVSGSIIIMGNGPSLRKVMEQDREALMSRPRMAVNFAANAPEYFELRPEYYILADPHFFKSEVREHRSEVREQRAEGRGTRRSRWPQCAASAWLRVQREELKEESGEGAGDPNVVRLWRNLARTDWPMHLWLPVRFRRQAAPLLAALPPCVIPLWFNLTPGEGGGRLTRALYRLGLAMPRPRNVLIPAIMMAMREGFREIYLVGADHSWLQSLWVDDKNRVVSVQPHFYKDNDKELERVAQEYAGYHLHDILGSMVVAFRSYFDIRDYAASRDVKIYNATPGSYIDAFPRRLLRE